MHSEDGGEASCEIIGKINATGIAREVLLMQLAIHCKIQLLIHSEGGAINTLTYMFFNKYCYGKIISSLI